MEIAILNMNLKNPISEFLHSGLSCQCCNKQMKLFLQFEGSVCLRGTVDYNVSDYLYEFSRERVVPPTKRIIFFPAYRTGISLANGHVDGIEMDVQHHQVSLSPKTAEAEKLMKERRMYFFLVCNDNAIKSSAWDYKISAYKVCSHKQSPFIRLKPGQVEIAEDSDCTAPIKFETFSFQNISNEIEKTYIVSLNYYEKKTQFYYWSANKGELEDPKYRPNVLSKKLPLLNNRPDLTPENRQKLFNKFDSWVLMS